jgi:hypothetical protein
VYRFEFFVAVIKGTSLQFDSAHQMLSSMKGKRSIHKNNFIKLRQAKIKGRSSKFSEQNKLASQIAFIIRITTKIAASAVLEATSYGAM